MFNSTLLFKRLSNRMQAFSLKNLAPVPNVVVVVVANPKGKIKKKGERERRKKVSYLFPFASPQFSSFLQFKIFLTLAGSVEARADKG